MLSEKEDPEELALSSAGKKHKLTGRDFRSLGDYLQLPKTTLEEMIVGHQDRTSPWDSLITDSFITDSLKQSYRESIKQRLRRF